MDSAAAAAALGGGAGFAWEGDPSRAKPAPAEPPNAPALEVWPDGVFEADDVPWEAPPADPFDDFPPVAEG